MVKVHGTSVTKGEGHQQYEQVETTFKAFVDVFYRYVRGIAMKSGYARSGLACLKQLYLLLDFNRFYDEETSSLS